MTNKKTQSATAKKVTPAAAADRPATDTSKSAAMIALLRRGEGASLDEMVAATGWQKHSVRGFMAGTLKKKHGLAVTSEKTADGRRYRLSAAQVQA